MAKELSQNTAPVVASVDAEGFSVGEPVGRDIGSGRLPTIPDRDIPFYLGHTPRSWELKLVGKDWVLLPILKTLGTRPGVNNVAAGQGKHGVPDSSLMLARFESAGWTVFKDTDEYSVKHRTTSGYAYLLRWDRLKVYSDGGHELVFDEAGYDAWRLSLVRDGRVGKPRGGEVAKMRSRLEKRIRRNEQKPDHPGARRAVKEAQDRLKGLELAVKLADKATAAAGASDG